VNWSAYYDRYRDMQLPVIVPTGNPISPQETLTQNAGSAEIWGLELETISKPLDDLTVWASVGYLHAKYLEFDADLDGNGSIDDNTDLDLMRTPKYYMHVETLYEFPLMDFGMLGVHAGWTYFSHQATTARNSSMTNVTALSLYDGSLIYRPMDSNWRFTVYGRTCSTASRRAAVSTWRTCSRSTDRSRREPMACRSAGGTTTWATCSESRDRDASVEAAAGPKSHCFIATLGGTELTSGGASCLRFSTETTPIASSPSVK
jgi:hypothetical protein